MKIVELLERTENKIAFIISDKKGDKVIQVDVRILPGDKIIVEAEHLTAPDPQANGLTFALEDVGATAVLQMPCSHEKWEVISSQGRKQCLQCKAIFED